MNIAIRLDNFLSSRFFINEEELLNQIQIDKKRVPNNLEEGRPDLLEEWDYKKNLLPPSSYTLSSNESVYWTCPEGHSYPQDIYKKIHRNRKCPYCNKNNIIPGYNSCIDMFPDLYTYVKNPSSVNLYKFGEKSPKQVEWVTGKHSISYFIKSFYLKIRFLIFNRN